MHHIWAQFEQDEQADAVDFLHALWTFSGSSFFAGRFFHRSERGHTEEREQFPLNLIFPDGEGPQTLDSLITQWANEARGQFLYGSPGGVVLNLQRSTLQEGTWTKHHRELELHNKVSLPFSEDGLNVHLATYQVVGLVLHQGMSHENGHYQSILAINNVYWLADDGTFPTPLPHLSSQQRKEISQIWLTAAPTDELVTDTAREGAEYLPNKPKPQNLPRNPQHHLQQRHFLWQIGFGLRVTRSCSSKKPTSSRKPWTPRSNTSPAEDGSAMELLLNLLAMGGRLEVSSPCMPLDT